MNKWIDKLMVRQIYGQIDRYIDKQMNTEIDKKKKDGWIN